MIKRQIIVFLAHDDVRHIVITYWDAAGIVFASTEGAISRRTNGHR